MIYLSMNIVKKRILKKKTEIQQRNRNLQERKSNRFTFTVNYARYKILIIC